MGTAARAGDCFVGRGPGVSVVANPVAGRLAIGYVGAVPGKAPSFGQSVVIAGCFAAVPDGLAAGARKIARPDSTKTLLPPRYDGAQDRPSDPFRICSGQRRHLSRYQDGSSFNGIKCGRPGGVPIINYTAQVRIAQINPGAIGSTQIGPLQVGLV